MTETNTEHWLGVSVMCNGTLAPCNAFSIAVQHHPHSASCNKREMVCFRHYETHQLLKKVIALEERSLFHFVS
jgi:hypothetical protein